MQISGRQKELLLDYGLGIASQTQAREAEELIRTNPQAAALYKLIQSALSPLDTIEQQDCPEELVEKTIARLRQAATGQRVIYVSARPRWFNRNIAQVAAVAAIVLFALGVGIPALAFTKNLCMRYRCQWQLARIYQGLGHYMSDFDGRMPTVAIADGQPWWKVGYQGRENHSNTRSAWLLVRGGYVHVERFLCPGSGQRPQTRGLLASDYNDFPGREFVAYSFRLCCDRQDRSLVSSGLIAADMNPLGERLPRDYTRPLRLTIDQDLLTTNTINHLRAGQNVLTSDGAVRFARTRRVGPYQDDIYSIKTMRQGVQLTGCEQPDSPADAFLVP